VFVFQLLSKRHSRVKAECRSARWYLLSVDNMLSCVADGQRRITEAETLYMLACRCMELHRLTIIHLVFLL